MYSFRLYKILSPKNANYLLCIMKTNTYIFDMYLFFIHIADFELMN